MASHTAKFIHSDKGFSIIEAIASTLVFSILGLCVVSMVRQSFFMLSHVEIGNAETNLAISKIEQLAGVPTASLTAANYNGTETDLSAPSLISKFSRQTVITLNGDGSKTIQITVSCNSSRSTKPIVITTTFSPWELS